ncbi:iron-chelator utilization protein [Leucobacter sp. 7(1)]|uniref:siderophore-interacting protein n=1 Tax=Leucobacter sp. 7(1) TaxID=1255613 RepID=UPI00097EC69A|nr:siderophore-interacting protein [Leucobacter sp. 7(1)]SJN10879.1 iron-chelator utilization protein [Leucobacter sp. 7(1)]
MPSTTPPRFLMYLAEVIAARALGPRFIRITFGGAGLRDFVCSGIAPKIKVWLPHTELTRPVTAALDEIRANSVMRTYTVREHRPECSEVDIDFVIHADGPAGRWAATATPGQLLLLSNAAGSAAASAERMLFIGDPSSLPAIMTALRALPRQATVRVLLRVDDAHERCELEDPASGLTEWITTGTDPAALTAAVRTEVSRFAPHYVWAAGEAGTLKSLRRYLRGEAGFTAASSQIVGYWRRDTPADIYDSEIIARAQTLAQSGRTLSRQEIDELSLGEPDPASAADPTPLSTTTQSHP